MSSKSPIEMSRRKFVKTVAGGLAVGGPAIAASQSSAAGKNHTRLEVGEGVADISPSPGIELAGFYRTPGNERRNTGIRQNGEARALVLRYGRTTAVIVSVDMMSVSREMTRRVQRRVADKLGIAAENIRVCATHTHSMPTGRFYLLCGAVSPEYTALVERRIVKAAAIAKADMAEAELHLGKSRAVGASFNRTTKNFKTDEHFGKDSTDDQRWLDTTVHVLRFERAGTKPDVIWYHFSAHPVCFHDDKSGPDWPGMVATLVREKYHVSPSFLQGHCGDVNPGDGKIRTGNPEAVAAAVFATIRRAMDRMNPVRVDTLRVKTSQFNAPLDVKLLGRWLDEYRKNPDACKGGTWIDARFAKAWYEDSVKQKIQPTRLPIVLSAMRLGDVGLVFHPAELYSYYGLEIRRDSPLSDTLVVGYADGSMGYAPDPKSYKAGEYAAIVVPKILELPPYKPTATRDMCKTAVGLLRSLHSPRA